MIDISNHYSELGSRCNSILNESLDKGRESIIANSHSTLFDYSNWLEILKNRPEHNIIKIAIREYQISLLINNLGLYNHAFMGLRYFFERTLTAVLFSAKELELRLWEKGERDTYWSEIVDDKTGIFSYPFCKAFFPDLKDETMHYKRMAEKVYRECSEYVHGNYSAQERLPDILQFDEFLFSEWHKKAETINRVVLFSFCLRYLNSLNTDGVLKIESSVLEEFGHVLAVREIFENVKQH